MAPLENIRHEPVHEDSDHSQEQVNLLYKAIKSLKEIERAVILLYLEDKQYKEIADILGMTPTNVGVRINRIKAQLKNYMDERSGH